MGEIDPGRYGPGSYGCHEALHTTSVLERMLNDHVLSHPSVQAEPEWVRLAQAAVEAVSRLYFAIADKHIGADHTDRETTNGL